MLIGLFELQRYEIWKSLKGILSCFSFRSRPLFSVNILKEKKSLCRQYSKYTWVFHITVLIPNDDRITLTIQMTTEYGILIVRLHVFIIPFPKKYLL